MKIVMAVGCFDLLHAGHIRHLMAARKLGDRLVVLLTPDAMVAAEKGPGRPVLTFGERKELLLQLECVDEVVANLWPSAVEAIQAVRPTVYVKGREYEGRETPALRAERWAVELYGGRVAFVGDDLLHTTDLIPAMAGVTHVSQEVPG